MVSSDAATVDEYIKSLPDERREAIKGLRKVILDNLPKGYKEGMLWGMITYYIPLKDYPNTYNRQPLGYAALASQKNYNSLYLLTVYGDPKTEKWFKAQYKASGKKLDMGKSCVHFKKLDDLPVDLIAETIARTPKDAYIKRYEAARKLTKRGNGKRRSIGCSCASGSDQFAAGRLAAHCHSSLADRRHTGDVSVASVYQDCSRKPFRCGHR